MWKIREMNELKFRIVHCYLTKKNVLPNILVESLQKKRDSLSVSGLWNMGPLKSMNDTHTVISSD